jgi:DNA-binding NarL/FixJ family response regulator
VRVVAAGDALIAPRITRRLIEESARLTGPAVAAAAHAALDQLTEREREVLELVAKGSRTPRSRPRCTSAMPP